MTMIGPSIPRSLEGPTSAANTGMPTHTAEPVEAVVRNEVPGGGAADGAVADQPATPVEVALTGPDEAPIADIGIGLRCAAAAKSRDRDLNLLETTDRMGIARFLVAADAARTVTVWSARGGQVTAALPDTPVGTKPETVRLSLRLAPRVEVAGAVVDANGQGIANAEIVLMPFFDRSTAALPPTWRIGRSGADGGFHIGLANGGSLAALHPDFSPSEPALVQIEPDASKPPREVTVRLCLMTLPGRASGVVVDGSGKPVPDAVLEFRPATAKGEAPKAPPQRTVSGRDGRFAVAHLRPGETVWAVRASGWGSTHGHFAVAPGETAALRVELQSAAQIQGTVQDERGMPVAGARVFVGYGFDSSSAITSASGEFALEDLAPGSTLVTATSTPAPDRSGEAASRATTVLQLEAGTVARWTAVLSAAANGPALRGTVVDPNGAPLAAWSITVLQAAHAPRFTITDASGGFEFRLGSAETVQVLVHAPEQLPNSFPAASLPGVTPGPTPLRIVVDASGGFGTVHGSVLSSRQEPIPATLLMWHQELHHAVQIDADQNGAFRVTRVPAGHVDITIDHPGCASLSQRAVSIASGADIDLGTLTLGAAAAVHGTVTGPDGKAPEQIEIYILTADRRLTAEYTGGTYRIGSVPVGKQSLYVQGPGIAAAHIEIQVEADTELTQDLQLQTGVSRRIEVTAPPECSYISLAVRVPGQAHQWLSGQPRKDHASAAFLAFMAPGTYEVVAWAGDGWTDRSTVTFRANDEEPIRLVLHRP